MPTLDLHPLSPRYIYDDDDMIDSPQYPIIVGVGFGMFLLFVIGGVLLRIRLAHRKRQALQQTLPLPTPSASALPPPYSGPSHILPPAPAYAPSGKKSNSWGYIDKATTNNNDYQRL